MAFIPEVYVDGEVRPWDYLPADAGDYTVGEALVLNGGLLVPVSTGVGEDTDEGKHYVSMSERTIAADGELLPVVAAEEEIVWEAPLTEDSDDIAIGEKYTITAEGVTATATKGCFKVLGFDGAAEGDLVRGVLE